VIIRTRRTRAKTLATNRQPQQPPWPKDVIARYLTIGGATVDVTGGGLHTGYQCTACPYGSSGPTRHENYAHKAAQAHAETCRGLPRPTA
jgi:hypothetical protein